MFKIKFSELWKYLKTTWNSTEQLVELTQKYKKRQKHLTHDILLFFTIVGHYYGVTIEGL